MSENEPAISTDNLGGDRQPHDIAPQLQRRKQHLPTELTHTATAVAIAATIRGKGEDLPGDTRDARETLGSPHSPSSIRTGSNLSRISNLTWDGQDLPHDLPLDVPGGDIPISQSHSQTRSQRQSPPPSPSLYEPRQHQPGKPEKSSSTLSSTRGDDKDRHYKMIFTGLYKSPKSPLARLRHPHPPQLASQTSEYDPDLVSKDKTKQKEAVRKHLESKIRNDWAFEWPPVEGTTAIKDPEPLGSPDEAPPSAETEGYLEVVSDKVVLNGKEVDGAETALTSGDEADSETDSIYSTVSETPLHWRPRLEWASELSEDELMYNSPSPFKFDTPDSIGQAVNASRIARKTRRRRELRKETAWNDGLACYEARRNAWTEAKVARVRPKPVSPVSPSSQRKSFFWRTQAHPSSIASQTQTAPSPPPASMTSPLTPATTNSQPDALQPPPISADSGHSTPSNNLSPEISRSDSQSQSNAQTEQYPVETLLPIAPPLLPLANPMRASITPALYNSIYEKVVVHSLQPSCPINLGDMVRACVAGWKRDGEWPPRPMAPEPPAVVAVRRRKSTASAAASGMPLGSSGHLAVAGAGGHSRRLSFNFLVGHGHGGEKDKGRRDSIAEEGSGGSGTGKSIRRSLQKVLGIGQHPSPAITAVAVADGNTAPQAQ